MPLCQTADDYAAWDDFLLHCPHAHYFQLHGWLASYQPMGATCEVIVDKEGGRIVAGAAFVSFSIPGLSKRVFILPHGPVCAEPAGPSWQAMMDALDDHFRQRGAIYTQLWPSVPQGDLAGLQSYHDAGYCGPGLFTAHNFSSTLLAVDIEHRSEEQLLADARRNTRYYARKALRSGLRLHLGRTQEDLLTSYALWEANGRYHGYAPRPLASYQVVFDKLVKRDRALLLQAWAGDAPAGSILVLFAGRTAVYAAGGMSREYAAWYPAEFMHLAAMRLARERGMAAYDFNHWGSAGTAQFKRGFRPQETRWAEPMTKIYRPVLARLIAQAEARLKPLLRTIARRRAARASRIQRTANGRE